MIKIEASTLEEAYKEASVSLKCSVTELAIEVVQNPTNGFLGLFKKQAIIVAMVDTSKIKAKEPKIQTPQKEVAKAVVSPVKPTPKKVVVKEEPKERKKPKKQKREKHPKEKSKNSHTMLNDTIMPASFVNDQDDDDYNDLADGTNFTADYDDKFDNNEESIKNIDQIATEIGSEINNLFTMTCFSIEAIEVRAYDENTILIEFKGEDAALLIGKEGYRYKALSYMVFNWINTKYDIQLRLEIAEFLKNQEESVSRYLVGVCENIEKDGRAQTKILDGVLVQIALSELRDRYPDKYVVIRSTRDGLKYIIVNDYHSN